MDGGCKPPKPNDRLIRVIDFMPGYINNRKNTYMNIGFQASPFPGKVGEGDYAPRRLPPMAYPTGPYPMDLYNYNMLGSIIPHPRAGSGLNPCFTTSLEEDR
jgi:hypothetical protein